MFVCWEYFYIYNDVPMDFSGQTMQKMAIDTITEIYKKREWLCFSKKVASVEFRVQCQMQRLLPPTFVV